MSDHISPPALAQSAVDALLDSMPMDFARKGRPTLPIEELVLSHGPITAEDIQVARAHVASGQPIGVANPTLKAIRNTHHRLAQLLAAGMDETPAGRLCNYSPSRVSVLKTSPAFQELLSYYADKVEQEFVEFAHAAGELSKDFLGELQRRLDETPEAFTPTTLMEAIRTLADRSGNAPVQRSFNVNTNVDLGARLAAARARVSG